MIPLTFVEIKLKPRIKIVVGKVRLRMKLFNFADYVKFNTTGRGLFNLLKTETDSAKTYLIYMRLVNFLGEFACPWNILKRFRLRKCLLKNVEAAIDLYSRIEEYNTSLKKKIDIIIRGLVGQTAGELSILDYATVDGANGKLLKPRFLN